VPGKSFLGAQAPTTDANRSDYKTQNYTGCIRAHVHPFSGAIDHESLTGFNDQSERQ
jgi:hypothetical protein